MGRSHLAPTSSRKPVRAELLSTLEIRVPKCRRGFVPESWPAVSAFLGRQGAETAGMSHWLSIQPVCRYSVVEGAEYVAAQRGR